METPAQRILDRVPLLSQSAALGGWAAAYAHGVNESDGVDPVTGSTLSILLCLGGPVTRSARDGVTYSYERLPAHDVTTISDIPFTAVLRTGFDGARLAPSLREAVAFLDPLLRATRTDALALANYVSGLGCGWKGIEQARRAIALANPAARSGWESRLRVWYVVEAGFPQPEVNIPVFDQDGRLLGMPDILDLEAATVLEFDGALHRERRRHRKDNVREEDFEAAGLHVVRVDSLDLLDHEPQLRHRVTRARVRGLARDRSRDRWTIAEPPWWRAQASSEAWVVLSSEQKAELLFGRDREVGHER